MPASLDQNRFQLENYSLVSGRQSSSVSNGIRLSRFVQPQEIWDEMFGVSVDGVQRGKEKIRYSSLYLLQCDFGAQESNCCLGKKTARID
ncbi:hypothetical protein CEXT_35151 [Caerostris extrusa]|uniref:Uncharacterized protein n=1 Tax=Caerostris extrusa TaxID=172846 RepID=A0AAV4VS66_CAEEX|nr:hypothetical protein CEXT_35151 [Caerostris extrusa]